MLSRTWRLAVLLMTAMGCAGVNDTAPVIELTKQVALHGVGDSVDLGWGPPAFSSSGYIAARRLEPPSDLVAIYDSTGAYFRTIGRAGGGPGEFDRVSSFGFGPGDSLWVFDGLFAAEVFAPPPRLDYVRSIRFDHPAVGSITTHGILAHQFFGRSRYSPARLLSWEGQELARFTPPDTGDASYPQLGPAILAGAEAVWIGQEGKYEIVLVGSDGAVRRRISRQADWFPEGGRLTAMPWVKRPPPWIHAISIGPDSLLWVLVRRANRDWETNKGNPAPIKGPISPGALSGFKLAELYEGVVEVFDPLTGGLIASRDVGGGMLGFVKPGVLWERIELDTGAIQIQLWDVRISR